MMPHEYEKEIRALKEKFNEFRNYCLFEISGLHTFIDMQQKQIDKLKELHGQADTQSRERPEERPKGHKKASKDG